MLPVSEIAEVSGLTGVEVGWARPVLLVGRGRVEGQRGGRRGGTVWWEFEVSGRSVRVMRRPFTADVLVVDGDEFPVGGPWGVGIRLWIMVPVLVGLFGGAVGGITGFAAMWVALRVLRMGWPLGLRFAVTGVAYLAAVGVWWVVAALLGSWVPKP